MKNKLEEFVHRNREAFDSEIPSSHIWETIDNMPVKKENKVLYLLTRTQVAAIVLLLLNGLVIFFLLQHGNINKADTPAGASSEQVTGREVRVSEDMLSQFSKVVERKQEILKKEVAKNNPALYKKFTEALNQLNTVYKELENELENNPNKEQLLEVMIQNLQLQQELLNEQLTIYQKIKNNTYETFIRNM